MSDFDHDHEQDWDERGDLAWNEFDWEAYLRDQDGALATYLRHYDRLPDRADRIDEVARLMGWEPAEGWDDDQPPPEPAQEDVSPYTLHRNPVFVATRALFASVGTAVHRVAAERSQLPARQAVPLLLHLQEAEMAAVLAIQSLDLGDYALGIAQFKRALASLNQALGAVPAPTEVESPSMRRFHRFVQPRLFDLREIWLRVIRECREELGRPLEDEGDEEE